jgi:chitin disaccharide deacetylase
VEVAALRIFAGQFRQEIRDQGMLTTDGTVGIAATGSLDQRTLLAILRQLPPQGTWELVCHPGYVDDDLKAAGGWLVESRRTELDVLISQDTSNHRPRDRRYPC